MKIQIEMKEVYGETKVYPVCQKAKIFSKIADTKTLTTETLKNIERLGYQLELIVNPKYLELVSKITNRVEEK